jgi:hypothetical protein
MSSAHSRRGLTWMQVSSFAYLQLYSTKVILVEKEQKNKREQNRLGKGSKQNNVSTAVESRITVAQPSQTLHHWAFPNYSVSSELLDVPTGLKRCPLTASASVSHFSEHLFTGLCTCIVSHAPFLKHRSWICIVCRIKSWSELLNKVRILQSPELSTDKICCFQQQRAFTVYVNMNRAWRTTYVTAQHLHFNVFQEGRST